jgi:hypothetical protein
LQSVFDLAECQAERRQLVAVDVEFQRRALVLEVAVDVDQPRQLAQLLEQQFVPFVELVEQIGRASCRERVS